MALRQIADALGAAVEAVDITELQVAPRLLVNPTPPAIDNPGPGLIWNDGGAWKVGT